MGLFRIYVRIYAASKVARPGCGPQLLGVIFFYTGSKGARPGCGQQFLGIATSRGVPLFG